MRLRATIERYLSSRGSVSLAVAILGRRRKRGVFRTHEGTPDLEPQSRNRLLPPLRRCQPIDADMKVVEQLNLTLLSQAPSPHTRLAKSSKTCLPAASCITVLMSVEPLDALLSDRCACSDRFIAERSIASFP